MSIGSAMSSGWHWFVIIGVVGSLIGALWLLFGNRHTSDKATTGHVWDGIQELDNPLPMWWVGLFVGTIAFAVPFLLYYPGLGNLTGLGNWSAAAQHDAELAQREEKYAPLYAELALLDESQLHAHTLARQVGRRLFLNNCATCHGVNANGSIGFPNLVDDSWIWGADFDTVKTTITQGRNAQMPAWGSILGDAGVQDISHYVLGLAGQPHDSQRATLGAANFKTFCVACHGPAGAGNPQLGAPNLTDNKWLYGNSIEQIAFTIRHGRSGNMPAQADKLTPEQIHILTGYVTSLSQ